MMAAKEKEKPMRSMPTSARNQDSRWNTKYKMTKSTEKMAYAVSPSTSF